MQWRPPTVSRWTCSWRVRPNFTHLFNILRYSIRCRLGALRSRDSSPTAGESRPCIIAYRTRQYSWIYLPQQLAHIQCVVARNCNIFTWRRHGRCDAARWESARSEKPAKIDRYVCFHRLTLGNHRSRLHESLVAFWKQSGPRRLGVLKSLP